MTKIKPFFLKPLSFVLLALFVSCCAARRSEPLHGPLTMEDASVKNGQQVFMAHCQKCHPGGEAGLGPALNSTPAPKFLKKFQVRHGLGMMPSFSEDQISDKELQDVVQYLAVLKRNK